MLNEMDNFLHMPPSPNTFNMNNVLAAFIMLTRLPFWKIKEVPAECFQACGSLLAALIGWLTGGVMAAVLWFAGQIMPVSLAWILALIARLFVTGLPARRRTGGLFDGFGGGTTRERTLAIAEGFPSGSYGVIGLICYFLLLLQLHHLPLGLLCILVLMVTAGPSSVPPRLSTTCLCPEKGRQQKQDCRHNRMMSWHELLAMDFFCGPVSFRTAAAYKAVDCHPSHCCSPSSFLPIDEATPARGYTGDCCGATFL